MGTTQEQVDESGNGGTPEDNEAGGKMRSVNRDDVLNGIVRRIRGGGRGEVVNEGKRPPLYPEDELDIENLDVPLDNQDTE
jgi:hypothetical protein